MITQERLEALKLLAEKATRGQWAMYDGFGPCDDGRMRCEYIGAKGTVVVDTTNSSPDIAAKREDFEYIAQLCPDVVLDLLAIATAAHAWRTARLRCLNDNTPENYNAYANAKTDLMEALDGATKEVQP